MKKFLLLACGAFMLLCLSSCGIWELSRPPSYRCSYAVPPPPQTPPPPYYRPAPPPPPEKKPNKHRPKQKKPDREPRRAYPLRPL